VVVVLKQKKEVLNVPVVMRVKQELVLVVLVNNVRRVNPVPPMMIPPIHVRLATRGIIKKIWAKLLVYPVFRVIFKM
jgi:hypothetical protein